MPVSIQNAADSGANGVATNTVTVNLGTNANRALWAQLADVTNGGNGTTAITLDGVDVSADLVGPTNLGGMFVYNLHHKTTLTGSKVLSATWASGTGFKSMLAVALYDTDPTTPFSGRQTQFLSGGTGLSLTIPSATGELVLLVCQEANGQTLTPGAGSSTIPGISGSFRHGLQEAGDTSVVIGGTWGASTTSWASGVSVKGSTSGYTITLDAGSYSLTGEPVDLLATRFISLDAGSYDIAGSDVVLTYAQPGVYSINLEAGSYEIAGSDALVDLSMNLESGSYIIGGEDLTLTLAGPQSYSIDLQAGIYTLTGASIALRWSGAPPVENSSNKLGMTLRIGI
jgi:hypothetical protein